MRCKEITGEMILEGPVRKGGNETGRGRKPSQALGLRSTRPLRGTVETAVEPLRGRKQWYACPAPHRWKGPPGALIPWSAGRLRKSEYMGTGSGG